SSGQDEPEGEEPQDSRVRSPHEILKLPSNFPQFMQLNATARCRACRLSAVPLGGIEPMFPDCRKRRAGWKKLIGKMKPTRQFDLNWTRCSRDGAKLLAGTAVKELLRNVVQAKVEGLVGDSHRARGCRARRQEAGKRERQLQEA